LNISDADNINYLVIFMTGSTPLPLGTAAGVYFSWPDPNSPPKWQYLGFISNAKPSAIFKISQLKKLHEMEETGQMFGTSQISHIAQIGVSIEPESSIIQQTSSTTNDPNSYFVFGTKILENFVNFASSYTVTQSQMQPNPNETYVPLSTLMNWFTNFQRRLQQNPNFWK
jgi:protein Hikeshi